MSAPGFAHGLHYVTRDGSRAFALDAFIARGVDRIERPERDVLASLLRFCLEGLADWDATDSIVSLISSQSAAPTERAAAANFDLGEVGA